VVELVLQCARAGGDDRLHARQQRGHQVREGLAGAGAGFGQQLAARRKRVRDRFGQALLRWTRDEAGNVPCEHPAFGERRAAVGSQVGHVRNDSGR
jgi:hypothetical protein